MSLQNFLDPKYNKDGTLYGHKRFKEIVRERYFISKKCHTSYNEVGEITPYERKYLIEFIIEEIEKEKQALEEKKAQKTYKRLN